MSTVNCVHFQISTAEPLPEFNGKLPVRTHVRSRSDASGLQHHHQPPPGLRLPGAAPGSGASRTRLQLGDLMSGRAFDNGCQCLESRHAAVNDLRGESTVCVCGAPRLEPQQEFLKVSLSNIGKRSKDCFLNPLYFYIESGCKFIILKFIIK